MNTSVLQVIPNKLGGLVPSKFNTASVSQVVNLLQYVLFQISVTKPFCFLKWLTGHL